MEVYVFQAIQNPAMSENPQKLAKKREKPKCLSTFSSLAGVSAEGQGDGTEAVLSDRALLSGGLPLLESPPPRCLEIWRVAVLWSPTQVYLVSTAQLSSCL